MYDREKIKYYYYYFPTTSFAGDNMCFFKKYSKARLRMTELSFNWQVQVLQYQWQKVSKTGIPPPPRRHCLRDPRALDTGIFSVQCLVT